MIACILGRQPELGYAELAALFPTTSLFSDDVALVDTDRFDIQKIGGTQKAGRVVKEFSHNNWAAISRTLVDTYTKEWSTSEQKVTFGISVYGAPDMRASDINRTALQLKQKVKKAGVSVRQISNTTPHLNTAVSHHNKLGLHPRKIELLVILGKNRALLAESIGAQNITALARRDQERPKRDAFVGMLPPKLALMMVNMGLGNEPAHTSQLLDPFCGTGVVLQEAYLRGSTVHGSDINPKMVDFTTKNLEWLTQTHSSRYGNIGTIELGDATKHTWSTAEPITAVVCETYLGQPFSATPSPVKLREVRGNCNHIISQFLRNISSQIPKGTRLCVAVPAWRDLKTGVITRLPLVHELERFNFVQTNTRALLYYREDQVVARDILMLTKN